MPGATAAVAVGMVVEVAAAAVVKAEVEAAMSAAATTRQYQLRLPMEASRSDKNESPCLLREQFIAAWPYRAWLKMRAPKWKECELSASKV